MYYKRHTICCRAGFGSVREIEDISPCRLLCVGLAGCCRDDLGCIHMPNTLFFFLLCTASTPLLRSTKTDAARLARSIPLALASSGSRPLQTERDMGRTGEKERTKKQRKTKKPHRELSSSSPPYVWTEGVDIDVYYSCSVSANAQPPRHGRALTRVPGRSASYLHYLPHPAAPLVATVAS